MKWTVLIVLGIALLIVCIIGLGNRLQGSERFNPDDVPGQPGYAIGGPWSCIVLNPPDHLPQRSYIYYSPEEMKAVCPTDGQPCKVRADCGPAEICINSAGYIADPTIPAPYEPDASYCSCSIANLCQPGVC